MYKKGCYTFYSIFYQYPSLWFYGILVIETNGDPPSCDEPYDIRDSP